MLQSVTAAKQVQHIRHVSRCAQLKVAALPPWTDQLLGWGRKSTRDAPGRQQASELLQLLVDKAEESPAAVRQRIDTLLDELQGCNDLLFQEQLLQGGPWRVLYTRGTLQLWKATYAAGKRLNASNAASQELDPEGRTVVNKAQYLGDSLWVSAQGTYQPLDDSPYLPKAIQANITSGCLHILGLNISLPIRGTGVFEVVYLDEQLRVFSSGGALAVQVKESYLQQQGLG